MTNCLFWALALYLRRGRRGYLVVRQSRWGPFPHFLYGERRADGRLRLVSYIPKSPSPRKVPPPCFRGKHRWGD